MAQSNVYLDFNATTPVAEEVKTMVPRWLEMWGNPSSIHWHGREPKRLLRESRRSLAEKLGVHPLEIVFTAGGSEANNLAIKGCLLELKKKGLSKNRVLLGAIEHPSVLKQKDFLEEQGFTVDLIPVLPDGSYDLDSFASLLDNDVALVSVMLANNEVGVIAPLEQMIAMAHHHGAFFHSDMVQALGKWPFDLKTLQVDLASFSGHKLYALKGAGFLYIKKGTPLMRLTDGGAQERRRRAGTENLMAVASLATMVDQVNSQDFMAKLQPLRDQMEQQLKEQISGLHVLCEQQTRLPNTSCFYIEELIAETLLMNLDIRGFSVGTGAACSSGNPEPSPVLLSLGLTRDQAQSSLRISFGRGTTGEQVQSFCKTLVEVVEHLRQLQTEQEDSCVTV